MKLDNVTEMIIQRDKQNEENDKKIMDAAKMVMYELLKKIHAAFDEAGFDTNFISVSIKGEEIRFSVNYADGRVILHTISEFDGRTCPDYISNWCKEHCSAVEPLDFYLRNRFYFCVKDWEEILMEETRRNDIPVKGKMPKLNGNFEYTGEYDTFALDGKRYRIKVGQDVYLNGHNKTWVGGQFVNQ